MEACTTERHFVFDTETTGLPKKKSGKMYGDFDEPNNIGSYDGARLVSISWIVSENHAPANKVYHIIKPKGFVIPQQSTAIHGITHEQAVAEGIPVEEVLMRMKCALDSCSTMVAHNIKFDMSIVMSEAYRAGMSDLAAKLKTMQQICTMEKGKHAMGVKKYPKLGELYAHLFQGRTLTNAHNAEYDTLHCYECFIAMQQHPHMIGANPTFAVQASVDSRVRSDAE